MHVTSLLSSVNGLDLKVVEMKVENAYSSMLDCHIEYKLQDVALYAVFVMKQHLPSLIKQNRIATCHIELQGLALSLVLGMNQYRYQWK